MSQTGVVSWSQTAASNATADANVNWAEGMAPSQVNDSARAAMASVAKWRDDNTGNANAVGGPTTYTYTSAQNFSSFSALNGQTLSLYFATSNGANPTLNIDGLGARQITFDLLTNITAGYIAAGSVHRLTYNSAFAAFVIHSQSPASFLPPGMISPYAVSTAPTGWLLCDGTGYSRTTYANLFSAISTTFGSSDGASFKVPNLKGLALVGMDLGGTGPLGTVSIASTAGQATITLSTGNIPQVPLSGATVGGSQTLSGIVNNNTGASVNAALTGAGLQATNYTINGSNFSISGGTVGGTASSFSVLQPIMGMNYIIKT